MCGVKFPETSLDGSGVNVSRTVSRRLERGLEKSLGLAYIIGFIIGCIIQFVGIPKSCPRCKRYLPWKKKQSG
jgi:hypothetical protein